MDNQSHLGGVRLWHGEDWTGQDDRKIKKEGGTYENFRSEIQHTKG